MIKNRVISDPQKIRTTARQVSNRLAHGASPGGFQTRFQPLKISVQRVESFRPKQQKGPDLPPRLFGADLELNRIRVISKRPNQIRPFKHPNFEKFPEPRRMIAVTKGDQWLCDDQGVVGKRTLKYDPKMHKVRAKILPLFSRTPQLALDNHAADES